jgi:uncharacterized ferritin-like protein (DUF455 family)
MSWAVDGDDRRELINLAVENAKAACATQSCDATHAYVATIHAIAHLLELS